MATKYDEDLEHSNLIDDDIRPEDSASNISGPTSITSSIARQLQDKRAAAAIQLKVIEEDAALLEKERKLELQTIHDERELRRKRREAKIEAARIKAEKEAIEARMKAEKEAMEARIKAEEQELEDEEVIKRLEAERRRESLQTEKKTGG